MTDGPDLLAAIIANPAEDTPRLMYADWLEENGQPARAEFVRVQVEIARLQAQITDRRDNIGIGWSLPGAERERCYGLNHRERELCAALALPEDFPAAMRPITLDYCRRGFVESLTCTAADWLAHGDPIRQAHPVTRVKFTGARSYGVEVWYDGDDEQWPVGEKLVGKTFAYNRIDRFIKDHLAHKPMGYRTLAVLMLRWPGVEFELPDWRQTPLAGIEGLPPDPFVGVPQSWHPGETVPPIE